MEYPFKNIGNENKNRGPFDPDKFILVLDMDECLIYFEEHIKDLEKPDDVTHGKIHLRPGLFEFLDEMKKIYNLVLFTLGTAEVN